MNDEKKPKQTGVEKAIVRYVNGQGSSEDYVQEVKREIDRIWTSSPAAPVTPNEKSNRSKSS
jgi:hypothetical protein